MAIRITGMYSGLDTESIINELASAQSYKKNKMVKAQTKLSWKQDAWKSLNTKIYSFYQKLDDLRLQSSYLKKKTVVSNPNALKVTGGKVDGSHKVSVERLSQRATVTSGKLNEGKNYNYSGYATLKQLGLKGSGSIRLSDNHGAYVDLDVNENMTINDFVKSLEKNTALTASFDEQNQRIYLSSWTSGDEGNFYLSGNDAGGMDALKALKLLSTNDIDKLTASGGEYDVWSQYRDASGNPSADYLKLIKDETLNRLKALKAENDKLTKENENYDKLNQKNLDTFAKIKANENGEYDAYQAYIADYDSDWKVNNALDAAKIKAAGDALYDKIYGTLTTRNVQDKNEDGTPKVDDDGNPVYVQAKNEDGSLKFEADGTTPVYETETVRTGGLTGELKDLKDDLTTAQDALKKAREDFAAGTVSEQDVKDAEATVAAASEAVSKKQTEIDKAKEVYSVYSAFDENESKKNANQAKIDANNERFTYDETTKTYKEKLKVVQDDSDPENVIYAFEEKAVGEGTTAKEVIAQLDKKVAVAKDMMDTTDPTKQAAWKKAAAATKVDGEDALIKVDGVTYNSSSDSLTVNGMTITALEVTDKDVTVSTQNDTEGVYNMIKDFIKAYSELINEMDSLYNAESSKGYEPLLTEEKDALSDSEIEEWEKKIKDSLLRRDSTLRDVSSALKMDMMTGFSIGGQKLYLSDFGIETLGYFLAPDNEKNAYHIGGDPDDPKTKNNADKLNAMINNNPEAVMDFFTGLTNKLHDTLQEKMAPSKMSSAMTFYNDKKMKEDYNDYTDKIKKQEDKLNKYIDNWYAKFSKMETALSKLESKNSSLSSLFGG